MEFKFTINTDNLNDPADIEEAVEDIRLLIRFLQRANPNYYLIGNLMYDQLEEQIKKIESKKSVYPKCLADSLNEALTNDMICSLLDISGGHSFSVKIIRDFGYNRTDAHVPNPCVCYDYTSDALDYIEDLIESEDCKNGCQIYEEEDGTRYLQITGANFYDKDNNYAGTNNVKVYFKEFVW